MNNLDKQYTALLQDILDNGVTKSDRTGTGTISVFGRQIRHNMKEGFPLLTTKKMPFKTIVTELLWFLRGDTNIKYLVDNNCHIWDGDAYANYIKRPKELSDVVSDSDKFNGRNLSKEEFINKLKTDNEFAKKWGELGPIYGKQWRAWSGYESIPSGWYHGAATHFKQIPKLDQIQNLINDLKTNPDSRRLMVNAWNVGELDQMVLPPCHYGFQVYTRELTFNERCEYAINEGWMSPFGALDFPETHYALDSANTPKRAISLMWNQRSVDTFLGLPFNIASYGLLLEIIAKEVNMVPDELIGNLGDVHLYSNHIEQAKEQIGREMTWEEQVQWVMQNTDVEMENLYIVEEIAKDSTPKHTRQPYPLPSVIHLKTNEFYESLSEDISLISHLEPADFSLVNYQSHPTIKAPLSN
jgi:thymidylate synthase